MGRPNIWAGIMEIEEETFICSNSEYIDCSNEVDDPSDMCNSCQAEYDISMNYFRSLYEKDKLNSGPKDDREVW